MPCPTYSPGPHHADRTSVMPTPMAQDCHGLVGRMYASRGLRVPPLQPGAAQGSTIVVHEAGRAIGTVTLRIEGSGALLAAQSFADEMMRLRDSGAVLCELTGLAIEPGPNSLRIFYRLLVEACDQCIQLALATDVVIEVHPRHARLYCRRFGFRQLGQQQVCARVGAPAVLLHQTIDALPARLALFGARFERHH